MLLEDHLLTLLKRQTDLLQQARTVLAKHLESLAHRTPITLLHNDYHAKNLMIRGGRIVPVDWSNAYLGHHLGDLYCLVQEAVDYGIEATVLIEAYFSEADDALEPAFHQWQVAFGGLCWSVRMLRWTVDQGVRIIPGAEAWIPNFTRSIEILLSNPTLFNG